LSLHSSEALQGIDLSRRSSPAPAQIKPQHAPAILDQKSVRTTLSITHHRQERPSTGPRTLWSSSVEFNVSAHSQPHRLASPSDTASPLGSTTIDGRRPSFPPPPQPPPPLPHSPIKEEPEPRLIPHHLPALSSRTRNSSPERSPKPPEARPCRSSTPALLLPLQDPR
jgi:hypothetical protein